MRFCLLITCFFFIVWLRSEESLPLSKESKLYLVTCGEGEGLESAFGHSAIRVVDSLYGIDVIFNYGSFNYSITEFHYHFLKGDPIFYLTIVPTASFLQDYRQQRRQVTENEIKIDSADRHEIFKFLMWNAQEDNYAYGYNFFTNNCATKIKDVLGNQGIRLSYNTQAPTTYRRLVIGKLHNHASYKFLLDIIFGMEADLPIGPEEAMFLPEHLQTSLIEMHTMQGKLLGETIILVSANAYRHDFDKFFAAGTLLVFLILLSLIWKNASFHKSVSFLILLVSGILGMFFLLLWGMTENTYVHKNLNLLWAIPFNAVAAWLLFSRAAIGKLYLKYYGYYLLAIPLILFAVPQGFYYGTYLWVFLLGIYLIAAHRLIYGHKQALV